MGTPGLTDANVLRVKPFLITGVNVALLVKFDKVHNSIFLFVFNLVLMINTMLNKFRDCNSLCYK